MVNTESQIILTTTNEIQGREIDKYLGIVSGESVLGTGVFSEVFASISDLIGAESSVFGEKLKEAKKSAVLYVKNEASKLGADAIVGADIEVGVTANNMFIVSVSGTAVKLKTTGKYQKNSKDVWVVNYCNAISLRFEKTIISARDTMENIMLIIHGVNYGECTIQAIRADIDLITIFDDCISIKGIAFDVIQDDKGGFETPEFEINVPKSELGLIKSIKIYVKRYVCNGKSINAEAYVHEDIISDDLDAGKEKYGKGYFADPAEFDDSWRCICGQINKKSEVCSMCGRAFDTINNGIGSYTHLYEFAIDKKNAIEIYELYKDYISKNPCTEMEKHIDKLKSIADIERMYGNKKNVAIKYIEENISE